MSARIRLVVIDDHRVVVESLLVVLSTQPGIEIVGQASAVEDGVAMVREHQPDVVLLDYHLGARTALDAIPLLLAEAPTRIVMLTALAPDQVLVECLRAGAVGFVSKEQSIGDVVAAVRAAHAGSLAVAPDVMTAAIAGAGHVVTDSPLSPREREVLSLLAAGRTNREIADELYLSVNTIRNHVAAVLAKLGARSRVEATAIAHRRRLVGDDATA